LIAEGNYPQRDGSFQINRPIQIAYTEDSFRRAVLV